MFLSFLWNSSILAEEKKDVKKFKQAFENKQITSEEFNILRKWEKEKKLNKNKKKKIISLSKKKNKNLSMNFRKKDKDNEIENYQIKELGEPKKISDNFFKKLMKKEFKGCAGFSCKGKEAGKYIYITFNKGPNWSARNSGKMIKAMAMYEFLYIDRLRDGKAALLRYLEKKNSKYLRKSADQKKIRGLISMNNGRKKMREALGMTLDTPRIEAAKKFWYLGEFLEMGTAVKNEDYDKNLEKRKKLLNDYKQKISKLKEKIQSEEKETELN